MLIAPTWLKIRASNLVSIFPWTGQKCMKTGKRLSLSDQGVYWHESNHAGQRSRQTGQHWSKVNWTGQWSSPTSQGSNLTYQGSTLLGQVPQVKGQVQRAKSGELAKIASRRIRAQRVESTTDQEPHHTHVRSRRFEGRLNYIYR